MTQETINFNEIYSKTREQVFNHALRVIKDYQYSEDITMKVFIKIDKLNKNEATRFNPEKSSLTTWVHTVTNSMILDFFRHKSYNKYKNVSDYVDSEGNEFFEFEASNKNRADSNVLNDELEQRINTAFKTLKIDYQKIAILYFNYQYSYIEISKILDMPMGSIKAMLNRCRTMLQIELKDLHNVKKVVTL